MSEPKTLSLSSRQLLANELVSVVSAELILDEDESLELYDSFYEVLDDMFSSRG